KCRIAGRHGLHALARVAMAVGAGAVRLARLLVPQRLAVEHPERAGVGAVVVLHGTGLGAHELVAGAPIAGRDFGGKCGQRNIDRQRDHEGDEAMRVHAGGAKSHATVMVAVSVRVSPSSPVQLSLSSPLSVATVWKVRNGLAAIAGNRSARNTSTPLYVHTKRLMMSRGTARPIVSRR